MITRILHHWLFLTSFVAITSLSFLVGYLFNSEPVIIKQSSLIENTDYQIAKFLLRNNHRYNCYSFAKMFIGRQTVLKMRIGKYNHYAVVFYETPSRFYILEANLKLNQKISGRSIEKTDKQIVQIIRPQ